MGWSIRLELPGRAWYPHLIQEGPGQRGSLVQSHSHSGSGAVAAEPCPLVRLSTAGKRIKFQIAGKSNKDLKDKDSELCNFA